MDIAAFKLERFFAEHEFKVRHLLSASDCESLSLPELLALADPGVLDLWERLSLGYTESQGHPLLRAEVARQYRRISPENVLIAAPEEAIFLAMNALLAPGDEAVVTWPAYQSLHAIGAALDCHMVRWPLAVRDGAWRLDVSQLAGLITPKTRLIVINFPHNPTGYLPTASDLDAIVAIAAQHKLHLFSDEMYRLLEYDPAAQLPSICDLYEHGVTLSGLSKAFGLPGLRIGWLATRDRNLLARCSGLKDYTTICNSAPSEILGIVALRAAEVIVARNLGIVRDNLILADSFFAAHAGRFAWLRPHAGSVAFPRLNPPTQAAQLAQELLDRHNTMLVPGEMFDYEDSHFRLGLGRRSFPAALAALDAHLA